jgi:predicted TIM-barrel fold metal-dependent hydrolase
MKIDIFPHILPIKYKEALKKSAKPGFHQKDIIDACPTITDLDMRFKVMDKYGDYVQVLTLVSPPVDSVVGAKDAVELSRIANDEMAELVAKYPDRFLAAVACLPLSNMEATLRKLIEP